MRVVVELMRAAIACKKKQEAAVYNESAERAKMLRIGLLSLSGTGL